ncbi:MAG: glycosyltransferase [Succinivibrio sp.]
MKFITVKNLVSYSGSKKELCLFNFPVYQKEKNAVFEKISLFGHIPLKYRIRRSSSIYDKNLVALSKFSELVKDAIFKTDKKIMVYFDLSLKGGTEVYSNELLKKLSTKYFILRVQYYPLENVFVATAPNSLDIKTFSFEFSGIKNLIKELKTDEIIINSLVAYRNIFEVLAFVSELKENLASKPFVSLRGHDFHSICPSYNLMNEKNCFCRLNLEKCHDCQIKKQQALCDYDRDVLYASYSDISKWRESFSKFFRNTADEMIVFSDSEKEYLLKVYPELEAIIKVIPHKVMPLEKANVPHHTGVNIGILGNIASVSKGLDVVNQLIKKIEESYDTRLVVLGSMLDTKTTDKVTVTGPYSREELPKLVERYEVDVILIPSVWPETFSYTTSEAIKMGVKTVCFDLGAQADKVKNYINGLVVSVDDDSLLERIINFVKSEQQT